MGSSTSKAPQDPEGLYNDLEFLKTQIEKEIKVRRNQLNYFGAVDQCKRYIDENVADSEAFKKVSRDVLGKTADSLGIPNKAIAKAALCDKIALYYGRRIALVKISDNLSHMINKDPKSYPISKRELKTLLTDMKNADFTYGNPVPGFERRLTETIKSYRKECKECKESREITDAWEDRDYDEDVTGKHATMDIDVGKGYAKSNSTKMTKSTAYKERLARIQKMIDK